MYASENQREKTKKNTRRQRNFPETFSLVQIPENRDSRAQRNFPENFI